MINPDLYSDSYDPKKQETQNSGFTVPVEGVYLVFNTWMKEKQFPNARKKSFGFHIVEAVKAVDNGPSLEEMEAFVGTNSSFDMFWDVADKRTQEKIGHLSLACRNRKEFNPDNAEQVAEVLLGVPYYLQLRIRETTGNNGKTYREPQVVMVQHAKAETVKKVVGDPDFESIMPAPEDRIKETYVHKGGGGGTKGGGGDSKGSVTTDPFDDDDLPF